MELDKINEKRIDKLEMEVSEMHKEVRTDLKELKQEMTKSISKGFADCREIMPLKCSANKGKVGAGAVIAISSFICSVVCGVILFLAKSGILELAAK